MSSPVESMSPEVDIEADTRVFWDVEDFPVPEGRELCSLRLNVRRALWREGYVGDVSIYAYGAEKTDEEWCHFARAKILLMQQTDDKPARLSKMLLSMIVWAYQNEWPDRANLIVVAKDIPEEDTDFVNVLLALKRRRFKVFLAVPDDIPVEQVPPRIASVVWRWTMLFDGKLPIEELDSDSENDADCDFVRREESSQCAEKRQKFTDAGSHK